MKKFYSFVLMAAALLIGTNSWAQNVAKNVTTGTEYETLQKAVKEASAGDVIQLIDDINCAQGVYVNKSLTIDLAGHTYQSEGANDSEAGQACSSRNIKIVGNGTVVTVKNGTMIAYARPADNYKSKTGAATGVGNLTANGAYGTIRTEAGSTVNLENLELYNYHPWGLSIKICATFNNDLDNLQVNPSTANIKNCKVYSDVGGGIEVAGGVANIESTTFTQTTKNLKYGYIACNVAVSELGRLTVNTTSFKSTGDHSIYIYSSGGLMRIESGVFAGTTDVINITKADAATVATNVYDTDYNTMSAEDKAKARTQAQKLITQFVTELGGSDTDNASQMIVADGDFDGKITVTTGTKLEIEGGTFVNSGLTTEQLEEYVNTEVLEVIVNADGSKTVVDKTAAKSDFSGADENSIVTIPESAGNTDITTVVTVKQLSIADGSSVTVKEGGELHVNGQMGIIIGSTGKLTIEAGGKVFVERGLVHNDNPDNLVIENSESKSAILLIAPNTQMYGNDNPAATVKFVSKACITTGGKNIYQRFGIPMVENGLISVEGEGNPETRFYVFNYEQDKWEGIGYINPSAEYVSQPLDITKLNSPFEYYQMMNFDATTPAGVVYTFKGNLLGNSEPVMQVLENSWKGFANSYMGVMKLSELLALIPNTVDKAIYTYNVNAAFASWEPVTNLNAATATLNPMQPFLIRNRYDAANVELDYAATVYNPALGIVPNEAPRRGAANNISMAKVTIANENSADYVIVAEGEEFTPSFDNGYDASKFMNDEVNLYVEAEENMSIFATDNLENTKLSVSSVLGGKYTISFSNVSGDNFVLVDNLTGAQTAMVEGNSYEFNMEANTVNSHRFAIVPVAKVPTAIENTEVKANVKGIYTITGQYVGENLEVLPAGVYVVNGVKIVK